MTVDLKTKHLLIGKQPPCTHQGYLVPVMSMVQTIPMPEDPEAKTDVVKAEEAKGFFRNLSIKGDKEATPKPPKEVITFVRTIEAICCRPGCNAIVKFGPPPQAPPAENAPAAEVKP